MDRDTCRMLLAAFAKCDHFTFDMEITDEDIRDLECALETLLTPRQKSALIGRYSGHGKRCNMPKTLKETGEMLGVCRERVRQLENKSFRVLRNSTNRARFQVLDKAWEHGRAERMARRK